jgi:hypothetical protein
MLGLVACSPETLGNRRPESARIPRLVTSTAANGGGSGSGAASFSIDNASAAGTRSAAAGAGGSANAGFSASAGSVAPRELFSFFVTSYEAMQRLAKTPNGFGGDLRYGQPDGLAGADKICAEIAESSMVGASAKGWRAFLSVTQGPGGLPVHAIDRVGNGPWYDRLGRVVALTRAELANTRPGGADPTILNDLPNEAGIPNHAPDGTMQVDNHDVLTGTNSMGQLFSSDWKFTCHDWTSSLGADGTPRVGHSWPRMGGRPGGSSTAGRGGSPVTGGGGGFPIAGAGGFPVGGASGFAGGIDTANWMSALTEAGCAAGASLIEMGPPNPQNPTVGSGGGYGGIYCFALTP